MSRFFTERLKNLKPYTPGEQPQDRRYIKLNTNESPYAPSPEVAEAVQAEAENLMLYSDTDCRVLRAQMSLQYGLPVECIVMGNGSDEILNFSFMAFADENSPLAFPDITYGFYPVFAKLNHIPYKEIPLKDDFSVDPADYMGIGHTIVLANPNAPTGKLLSIGTIESILQANPQNIVIIDEAYIDFGGESAAKLVPYYDNLLVVGTFSKSRSLAGARLGFAFGNASLIGDINTLRFSTNPYNVNSLSEKAGIAALQSQSYYDANCRRIAKTRAWTAEALQSLGFSVTESAANFLFVRSERIGGEALYLALREKGILIRHFDKERIRDYNRITIGTRSQMEKVVAQIGKILEESR